jgi:hypothetical protein
VHELDLPVDDLAPVLVVGVRSALQVEVLGVDGLLVDELVLLGGQVLDPVVPLSAGPELAEGIDVDGPGHPGGAAAVVVPPDDLAAVVDHGRTTAEGVDRDIGISVQVVGADVAGDQVEVVVQRPGPVLHLEQAVADVRMRIRAPVHYLGAVHGQPAGVLRVRALVGHQEPEPADLGVGHRVERVQVATVQLDPLVPDVMRGHRVLDRQQRHHLVMPQDDLPFWVQDEADVEEAAGEFRVPGLGLAHQEHVPLPGQGAERVGLGSGDVDRALPGERLVVQVENLVVEALQGAFRNGDQPHRQVQAG